MVPKKTTGQQRMAGELLRGVSRVFRHSVVAGIRQSTAAWPGTRVSLCASCLADGVPLAGTSSSVNLRGPTRRNGGCLHNPWICQQRSIVGTSGDETTEPPFISWAMHAIRWRAKRWFAPSRQRRAASCRAGGVRNDASDRQNLQTTRRRVASVSRVLITKATLDTMSAAKTVQ